MVGRGWSPKGGSGWRDERRGRKDDPTDSKKKKPPSRSGFCRGAHLPLKREKLQPIGSLPCSLGALCGTSKVGRPFFFESRAPRSKLINFESSDAMIKANSLAAISPPTVYFVSSVLPE
ncbi:hypothetical protein KM043_005538 [Ampulex compressa]|nr:hypothetical protein KM043_005538 [Ampulex compressa]